MASNLWSIVHQGWIGVFCHQIFKLLLVDLQQLSLNCWLTAIYRLFYIIKLSIYGSVHLKRVTLFWLMSLQCVRWQTVGSDICHYDRKRLRKETSHFLNCHFKIWQLSLWNLTILYAIAVSLCFVKIFYCHFSLCYFLTFTLKLLNLSLWNLTAVTMKSSSFIICLKT